MLDQQTARAAVYGGAFLGGGGGGSLEEGLKNLEIALRNGPLRLLPVEAIDDDAVLVTASLVGSPASKNAYVDEKQVVRALELYQGMGEEISGIITNENGGCSTTNGWILSAVTGLPLVDAPCNGRAHPTGQMGSMGLGSVPGFVSRQSAAGGNPQTGKALELAISGPMDAASHMVRLAASEADGMVTVLRNGVCAGYVKKHAAPGAVRQAVDVGRIFLENQGNRDAILSGLSGLLDLTILTSGKVYSFTLTTQGGYDVGAMRVGGVEVTFWNEFMTAECEGECLATFPDLIAALDAETGAVRSSAQIAEGDEILLVKVPKAKLLLGRGMYERELFAEAERVIQKELIPYNF